MRVVTITKHANIRQNKTMQKLMKGKALRKHSLHEKTAASVLLKLFISRKIVIKWDFLKMFYNNYNTVRQMSDKYSDKMFGLRPYS